MESAAPPTQEEEAAPGPPPRVADAEADGDDWYVHAHPHAEEEDGGDGGGGSTQGPMSRAEAVRVGETAGGGGEGLVVWHPTATAAWTPWREVRA